jgi:hypothetical protein
MKKILSGKSGKNLCLALALTSLLAVAFHACSGGGGGISENVQLSYTAGGSAGELLTYTADITSLKYSATVVESRLGLEGNTYSGKLTDNKDGAYSPADNPNVVIVPLADKFIVGGVDVGLGGPMLFTGVPKINTNYTKDEIAGVYNFVSYECYDDIDCFYGDYYSYSGTFEVSADGGLRVCNRGNISDTVANPCLDDMGVETFPASGAWKDNGDGTITATISVYDVAYTVAKVMFLPSTGGGRVIVGDTKLVPSLGNGAGILVGVRQFDADSVDISGKYTFYEDNGSYGTVTVDGTNNTYESVYYDAELSFTNFTGSGVLTRNEPWQGWIKSQDGPGGYPKPTRALILPDAGVYINSEFFEPDDNHIGAWYNNWIEVGAKVQ